MTLDITQAKIKSKDTGVYCDGVLVKRFYNIAQAIIWLADLSVKGIKFPEEIKQCAKNEKANLNHILKYIR